MAPNNSGDGGIYGVIQTLHERILLQTAMFDAKIKPLESQLKQLQHEMMNVEIDLRQNCRCVCHKGTAGAYGGIHIVAGPGSPPALNAQCVHCLKNRHVNNSTGYPSPNPTPSPADPVPEKKLNRKKRWEPENKGYYYWINSYGNPNYTKFNSEDYEDLRRIKYGNVFEHNEDASIMAHKIKRLLTGEKE